jgi:nucleoredoxin
MEALFGPTLLTKDGEKPTADALRGKGVVGIYFSAHWCPPCRGFTPKLSKWYLASLRDKGMAIVFVSSDKDQASFDAYFGEQPWVALPFGSRDAKATLSARFGVKGIPALILVDGATGDTINAEGRETVTADPRGTLYPWARGGAASPPGSPAVTNEPSAASPPGAASPPEQQQSGELFRKDWKHTWKGGTYTLRGQTLRRSGTTKPVAEVQGIFDIPERRSAGGTKAPRAYRFDVTTATGTLVSLAAGSAASKARWVRSLASAARLLPLEDHPRSLDFERAQEGASIVDAAAAAGLSAEAAADCPKSHGLRRFIAKGDGFHCDSCREEQREGRAMYGCRACDYDVCEPCSKLPRPPICPSGEASCGKPMRLSVYDKEGYEAGWVCDRCGSDSGQTGKDSERWFCHDCGSDVCFDCLARPKMFNDAGLAVVRGAAADNCTDRFYCGTRRNIPGSDGQCGPSNGPQCSSCARFQSRYGRRDVDGYGNSGSDVELSEDDDGGGGDGSGSDDEDGDDGDPGDGDALGFDENDLDEMLTGHRPCCEDCAPFCRRPRGCCAGEDACISILCGSSHEKKSGACNQVLLATY